MRTLDTLAHLVSAITSPFVVICGFALWIIARYSRSGEEFALFGGAFVALIILLPFAWIQVGIRRGKYTDIHVMIKEQRFEPFVVATVGACLLVAFYLAMSAPRALTALAANLVVNGVVFAIVSRLWKISVHAASYAASVLIVTILIDHRLVALLVLLPLVIWARIRRQRHNVAQAIAAASIVCLTTWAICSRFA